MIAPPPADSDRPRIGDFVQRGHRYVGRIEGFSDAVFGFSITLLVVSQQVPKTFDQLLVALAGFPGFALSFSLLAQIWYLQNRFFRRYGLHDGYTIALNLLLLFVVVFFTYPLKFLFSIAVSTSITSETIRPNQLFEMYVVYGIGYAAIFALFLALHAHAYAKREELDLSPLEAFATRYGMLLAGFQIVVGCFSIAVAGYFDRAGDYESVARGGGMAYLTIPVGLVILGAIFRRRRRRYL